MSGDITRQRVSYVWAAAILLAVLHHDFWFWNDPRLVFGFIPVGLAYHAFYSLSAACLWLFAVKFAWPTAALRFAETPEPVSPVEVTAPPEGTSAQ